MAKKPSLAHPEPCHACSGEIHYIVEAEKYKKPGETSYLYCTSCGQKYTYVVPQEEVRRKKRAKD